MATKKKSRASNVALRGFFRMQLVDKETKEVQGDSGWVENQITNYGLESCLVAAPLGINGASSNACASLILGNGTVPASTATALPTSNSDYRSSFTPTVVASLTARMVQSFDGTLGAATLANIGVIDTDTKLVAGNTFTSSALATTQDVNCTYEIRYTTS